MDHNPFINNTVINYDMSETRCTSIRIKPEILQKIQEKCPDANRSLILNNVLDYLLAQNDDLILEFTKKQTK